MREDRAAARHAAGRGRIHPVRLDRVRAHDRQRRRHVRARPSIGSFLRVAHGLRIPTSGKIYSVNEANSSTFPEGYQQVPRVGAANGYSSRYIGAMVADVHRTLLKGGVFLYPPTKKAPDGKLRLMYEANPMAMIVEQAGGLAYSGDHRTLDVEPAKLHQRVPVLLGSPDEVERVRSFL
jgi:fructose-1,6-bisphosphatase I